MFLGTLEMNNLLIKHKPKDIETEAWKKMWDNSSYIFRPLVDVINQLVSTRETVREDDFDCPNHYAKLAFDAGMRKGLGMVLDMLPESAKIN